MDNNEEVAYTELWFRRWWQVFYDYGFSLVTIFKFYLLRYYLLAHFFNKWKMKSTNLQVVITFVLIWLDLQKFI